MLLTNPIEIARKLNTIQDSIARLREYYSLFILAFGETQKQYEVLGIESKDEFKRILLDLLGLNLENKDLDSILQSKTLSKDQNKEELEALEAFLLTL